MELSFCDRLDWVWSEIETSHDNDVTDHTSVAYIQNDIELLWSIRSGAVCDENQTK